MKNRTNAVLRTQCCCTAYFLYDKPYGRRLVSGLYTVLMANPSAGFRSSM